MKSLPSSGERRLRELRQRLILDLYLRRGEFWRAVSDIRGRWGISATSALPPSLEAPGSCYLPPQHPSRSGRGREGEDEFITYARRWRSELRNIHDSVMPEDCRLNMISADRWSVFLSACVIYDPPVPGLTKFAETGAGSIGWDTYPRPADNGPDYGMTQSPIVQLRDADKETRAVEDFWLGVVGDLIEWYVKPQGYDEQQIIDEILFETPEARKRWERRSEAGSQNEAQPYIKVGSETTEQDVRNAFRMLTAAHKKRPRIGRTRRDLLLVAECAILHDRHGWKYERIAEHYGWQDTTAPSKHIRHGRKILDS